MRSPSIVVDEAARLAALDRYAILDTSPEEAFDDVVRLAASICQAPIALISLIDSTRQWFKARVGIAVTETPRESAFCRYALEQNDVLLVPDAFTDDRFARNPLVVGEPYIRFYAGAPLTTPEGLNLGTVCVIDRKPRTLTGEQLDALRVLARQVMVQLELRRMIAERTIAEEEHRRSETRMRSILDNALGSLIATNQQGLIESVNVVAERTFGYSAGELDGRALDTLLEWPAFVSLRDVNLGRMTESVGRKKSGQLFTCEIALFELYAADDQRHFAAHILDVSERHEVERMKRDFITTVSHELRTPLTSICASLGLLASDVMGELSPEARRMVTVAERNSVRLMSLVNDILDFDKLQRGTMEMEMQPVSLRRVLEQAVAATNEAALQAGVTVELRETESVALGDSERLVQVATSLLSNAVKYSPRGGIVRIEVKAVGESVEVRIEDRGSGIAPELQARLFRRFERADSSDARTKPGTGLGLSISKAIVERHGGTIGVDSREGEGSTFWFRLRAVGDYRQFLTDRAGASS